MTTEQLQVLIGAAGLLVAVAALIVAIRQLRRSGRTGPAAPPPDPIAPADLDQRLGGVEVRRQLEQTIRGLFSDGRRARSFQLIRSRCRGVDQRALRQLMHAMGMEAYTGPESRTEFWRFRR